MAKAVNMVGLLIIKGGHYIMWCISWMIITLMHVIKCLRAILIYNSLP